MQIKQLSENGFKKLIEVEGLRLKAYPDTAGVPTIGIGNTYYPDKKKVKLGDVITRQQAFEYARLILPIYETPVNNKVTVSLNQNQFDALVLFCYNVGGGNFSKSTLLKRINLNASKEKIIEAWMRFTITKGKHSEGLENRRRKEIELYFK